MWKKVNLTDPQNLATVAGQRRQILAEKYKNEKKSVQQSGVAKSGLHKKKLLKKVNQRQKTNTLAARGLEELFFQLWFCVSFWFWQEIDFGFTYLCT
jgi:hypothetical protein